MRGRTLLMSTYAAGLRVSEVCALQVGDIESAADRMCPKVRQGKGSKDRYTPPCSRRVCSPPCAPLGATPGRSGGCSPIGPAPARSESRPPSGSTTPRATPPASPPKAATTGFGTHLIEAGVDLLQHRAAARPSSSVDYLPLPPSCPLVISLRICEIAPPYTT
ncbi:tyrosine-type recombinase/integrase [Accumulibacter sp.]|uniref:tyrosine-type recombinase/integrase n=1 Tax=Accumulibacter sp. TaxID=2053492 RepID=UPI0034472FC5